MPVNLPLPDAASLFPIAGVRIGVTEAGIRKVGRKDLTVVLLDEGASVSGVFTTNRFCAAPVQLCREHLASGQSIRALLINTGNANAGTGDATTYINCFVQPIADSVFESVNGVPGIMEAVRESAQRSRSPHRKGTGSACLREARQSGLQCGDQ